MYVCENAMLEFRSEVPVTRYLVFGVHVPQIPVILNWWRLRTKVSLFGYQVVPGSPRYWGMDTKHDTKFVLGVFH